jgi:peptidoglycan hydrolase-like protein with peptidoglycan-binding domain
MALLKSGSAGNDVAQLQQFLKSLGLYQGSVDGKYGPLTKGAVQQFQRSQNINSDGIVGPITQGKISSYGKKNEILNDPGVQQALQNDPDMANQLSQALDSGDIRADNLFDYVSNYAGLPYTEDEVKRYAKEESKKLQSYYNELQTLDRGDIEDQLGLAQRNYDRALGKSASEFAENKDASDVSSANRGVLFSTGRQQELQSLGDKASAEAAATRDELATASSRALRDYQGKWGGDVNKLGNYMKLGGQTYDAFIPGGGKVTQTGLKSIYNPKDYKLTGTKKAEQANWAAQNAYNRLANKTNKQSLKGYNMQF